MMEVVKQRFLAALVILVVSWGIFPPSSLLGAENEWGWGEQQDEMTDGVFYAAYTSYMDASLDKFTLAIICDASARGDEKLRVGIEYPRYIGRSYTGPGVPFRYRFDKDSPVAGRGELHPDGSIILLWGDQARAVLSGVLGGKDQLIFEVETYRGLRLQAKFSLKGAPHALRQGVLPACGAGGKGDTQKKATVPPSPSSSSGGGGGGDAPSP